MNFSQIQTHGLSPEKAFETLCNQLFENYCREIYNDQISHFRVVNGAGGDGGVESYLTLKNRSIIGLQAKWFLNSLGDSQFSQIKNSIKTAMAMRPTITRYIVCIPRDLADLTGRNDPNQEIANTEVNRWGMIKSELAILFPALTLELWTEFNLLKELQKASNQGALKYWFNNSQMDFETIRFSFNRQRAGWVSQRFLEDLHVNGVISEKIDYLLGNDIIFQTNIKYNNRYINLSKTILNEIDDFLSLKNLRKGSKEALLELKKLIIKNIDIVEKLNNAYEGKSCDIIIERVNQNFSIYLDKLKNDKYRYSSFFYSLKRKIEKISSFDFQYDNIGLLGLKKLIIFGSRGTGKTHGIINKIKEINSGTKHIGVLVQASNIDFTLGWKDVLTNALGLATTWSDEELFGALEAMAHSNDTIIENLNSGVKSNILICVDGIDEKRPYDCWTNLIKQIDVITARFPRIKFCFTSRPYVFDNEERKVFKNPIILYNSDVSVPFLFDSYIKHFNVEIGDKRWIKWHLKTPLMLRLFCEQYSGKQVDHRLSDNIIVSLFNEKIKKIENEFCVNNPQFVVENEVIRKSLLCLAEHFIGVQDISENDALVLLEKANICNYYSTIVQPVINFLCEVGILGRYMQNANSLTKRVTKIYINSQPIFDYIFALLIYEKIDELRNIDYHVLNNRSVMELLAVMLFPQNGLNFFERDLFKDVRDKFNFQCYALLNCHNAVTADNTKSVKQFMLENTANFMSVVNGIILDAARIKGHPLGANFLSSILREFKTPIERDLFFSMPTKWAGYNGYRDYQTKWDYENELNIMDEQYSLSIDDKYDEMPLVFAWTLSLLDNEKRTYVRNCLYKWSIIAPEEFEKLFVLLKDENDPQVRADLFSVAMSTVYELPISNNVVKGLSRTVFDDVYANDKLIQNKDIAIRFYSEQICEKAFIGGYLSREEIAIVRSKKSMGATKIPLHKDAFGTDHCGSYGVFDYDLTRYVLCDPISELFFERHDASMKLESEQFLQTYAREYGVDKLSASGFIMAAAYQFFIDCGYSERLCEQRHKDGKKSNIAYRYGGASHGAKSSIYSIAEKYARRAKYYLLGYLSDNLFIKSSLTRKKTRVEHYTDMETFIVPYQDAIELDGVDGTALILPQPLNRLEAPKYGRTANDICYNIKNNLRPNFEKFLFVPDSYNTLLDVEKKQNVLWQYIHSCDEDLGIETSLWISSALATQTDFSNIINDIKNGDDSFGYHFLNPDHMRAYSEAYCYLNPSEICTGRIKSELTMLLKNKLNKTYRVYYTAEKCTASISLKGDVEYLLPSMAIRSNCGIVKGNGYEYFDFQNSKIGTFYSIGETFEDSQHLLTFDSDRLNVYLVQKKLVIFWVCKVSTEITNKAFQRLDKPYGFEKKDESYIVWFDNQKTQILKL